MNDAGITSAFDRIADEWDKAEKLIKTAEITRNEVVIASVNELRYAGRRLVDALRAADACRADPTCTKSQEDLNRYVSETLSFCQRALHDAVDAIILHVRTQIGEYEKAFGYAILADKFPEILDIKKTLRAAEQLVILSREDREKRSTEYDKLANDQIPLLLEYCDSLEANRDLLKELVAEKHRADRNERKGDRRFWMGVAATIITGLILLGAKFGLDTYYAKVEGQQNLNEQPTLPALAASASPETPN